MLPTGKSAITGICNNNNHIIHTLYYIVGKYIIQLHEIQKQVEKRTFLSKYIYDIYPAMQKYPKHLSNCVKTEKASFFIVFYGVPYKAGAYSVTVSYHRSTCIRYQKTLYLLQWSCMTKRYPVIIILLLHWTSAG